MITDWGNVAERIGSLKDDGSQVGGDDYARKAFEEILGEQWIATTVEHAISFKPGYEVAMNCLQLLNSEKAVLYAYTAYKNSTAERASQAVWLIKHINHPIALNWVNEFLNDENVAGWGIGVLDQLLWCEQIQLDNKVIQLLHTAETVFDGRLKDNVEFIREYLKERMKSVGAGCS